MTGEKMASTKLAVVELPSPSREWSFLLRKDIAGLNLFKRLILTLQKTGLEKFLILSRNLPEHERCKAENDLKNDNRFKSQLHWLDKHDGLDGEGWNKIEPLAGNTGFLLLRGNIVTSWEVIKDFLTSAEQSDLSGQDKIARLSLSNGTSPDIYLVPSSRIKTLEEFFENRVIQNSMETILLDGSDYFLESINNTAEARAAEKSFIQHHKNYYTQFMDVWLNSVFSLRISSLLVKTPLTPNQLTLFGLLIGFLAGICFAKGDYIIGLGGGFLLAFTGIWDCCDGDVARLKFMESDFGETLDTICDNIINIFIFVGIMIGTMKNFGWNYALIPFGFLAIGGTWIFLQLYIPKGGKGSFFKKSGIYEVILLLASRNFIYIILLFAVIGRLDWFLWIAGIGSNIFALTLYLTRKKILEFPVNSIDN